MKKLISVIIVMTLLTSCENNCQKAESNNNIGRDIEIDTLYIHGNKHEVLFWFSNSKGGMMHSPECWCLKENKK